MSKHEERLKEFAELLVKQIEENNAPWQRGWKGGVSDILPVNHQGKPYRGNNLIELMMVAHIKGYSDNRWYTFNNAQEYGGHVRKGEKGTVVTFFSNTAMVNKKDEQGNTIRDKDGNAVKELKFLDRPVIKTAVVFNAEQIDGLPPKVPTMPLNEWERHSRAEAIIKGVEQQGVTIEHRLSDTAFYSPTNDKIVMPERTQFETADTYYATILHEIGHSTGHESRLNRDLSGGFGSENYAKEELRAEIASMMIGQELQIGYDPSQHHAYLKSWSKVIQDDPTEILRAVKDADKIAEYVLNLGRDIEIKEAEKDDNDKLQNPSIEKESEIQSALNTAENDIFKVPTDVQEKFNADVERLDTTLVSYPKPIQTPTPPILLALDGIKGMAVKDLPFELDRWTLKKIQGDVKEKEDSPSHILRKEDVKEILSLTYNPVAVLASDKKDGFIVVTNAVNENNRPVIVSVHLDKTKQRLQVNDIASIYGRKNLDNWLSDRLDKVLYYNAELKNEKVKELYDSPNITANSPLGVVHNSLTLAINILKPEDIVKRYNEISQLKAQDKLLSETTQQEPRLEQSLSQNQQDKRLYLYTSFNDLNALNELKTQGIVRFDTQNKVWYAQESNREAVAQWTTRPSVPSPEQALAEHLQAKGIVVTAGHPMFDSKTHRLANDGSQAKNVMYQAYANPNGVPFARITNFSRDGEPENWQYPTEYLHILKNIEAVERAKGNQSYSHNQTVTLKPQSPQSQGRETKELSEDKIAQQNLMAERAKMVMSFAPIAPKEQNYLARKQVTANDLVRIVPDSSKLPDNLKEHILIGDTPKQFSYLRENNPDKLVLQRGNLMIPQFNAQGDLRAFETISYNGGKYALQGAEKQGLSTTLGKLENGKPIILVEGYATGATLHEQTGRNVVVAFGRNGLMDIAQILHDKYPDSKIYIGADNDHQKPLENKPNIGLEDAQKVAQIVPNTHVLVPQFNRGDTGKDWNDILVDKGVNVFKEQVKNQLNAINPQAIQAEKTKEKVEPSIPASPNTNQAKDPLDVDNIKSKYPNMSDNNLKAIQAWREYLPVKYASEPIKVEIALNRLADKLPDFAQGEQLNPPKSEQQHEQRPPDTGR